MSTDVSIRLESGRSGEGFPVGSHPVCVISRVTSTPFTLTAQQRTHHLLISNDKGIDQPRKKPLSLSVYVYVCLCVCACAWGAGGRVGLCVCECVCL